MPGGSWTDTLGYHILRRVGRRAMHQDPLSGNRYRHEAKLELHFGPQIWAMLRERVVLDFGCGDGRDAIQIAAHGAKHVIGVDIRRDLLQRAREQAQAAGVATRVEFTSELPKNVDVVLSVDGFEHYSAPASALDAMRSALRDDGRILISFGPPWYHPLGGHLFSVFPWAHVLFSEAALIRWRSDFKSDGARRFSEVAGGLNQMTVKRFEQLIATSPLEVDWLEAVPIRRLAAFSTPATRELTTALVKCQLRPYIKRHAHAHDPAAASVPNLPQKARHSREHTATGRHTPVY